MLRKKGGEYLYDKEDPVIEYVVKDNDETKDRPPFLYGDGNEARVVVFYNPYCGACKSFVPKYLKLAKDIQNKSTKKVTIHAVSCHVHKTVCQDQKLRGYPGVKAYKKDSNVGEDVNRNHINAEHVLQVLGIDAGMNREEVQKDELTLVQVEANKPDTAVYPAPTQEEIFSDAALSFVHSLESMLTTQEFPFSDEKQSAFLNWIDLLKTTTPPELGINTILDELSKNLDAVTTNHQYFQQVTKSYKSSLSTTDWSESCKKGSEFNGYTCGLWQLFHIMTAGVVERNQKMRDDTTKQIPTALASDTLRNFVANFFDCVKCRDHFVEMYDSCSNDRCFRLSNEVSSMPTWKALPIWLWAEHNDVNIRLDKVNAKWPSKTQCTECWGNDDHWNLEHVYLFLQKEYWPATDTENINIKLQNPVESKKQLVSPAFSLSKKSNSVHSARDFLWFGMGLMAGYLWTRRRKVLRVLRRRSVLAHEL